MIISTEQIKVFQNAEREREKDQFEHFNLIIVMILIVQRLFERESVCEHIKFYQKLNTQHFQICTRFLLLCESTHISTSPTVPMFTISCAKCKTQTIAIKLQFQAFRKRFRLCNFEFHYNLSAWICSGQNAKWNFYLLFDLKYLRYLNFPNEIWTLLSLCMQSSFFSFLLVCDVSSFIRLQLL